LDSSRVLVAVILSIVLIVAYQELVLKRFYPPPTQQQLEQAKADKAAQARALGLVPGTTASAVSSPAAGASLAPSSRGAQLTAANPGGPERTVKVDSDYYVAVLTSRGARLKSFKLKAYKQAADKNSGPYEMVQVSP
jgi:YidC/Oxa1 family membrane protein insertase